MSIDNTIIQNLDETQPHALTPPDKGSSFHAQDPSIYPGSYNLKLISYSGSLPIQIDFYVNAQSISNTGSLVFTQQMQYDGSGNCIAIYNFAR
jgi:hypothetical protein